MVDWGEGMSTQSNKVAPCLPSDSVAYLVTEYPMISHTFILREVTALRELGVTIHTCSIRRPDPGDFTGAAEIKAHGETFFVQNAAKKPANLLRAHVRALRRSPGRWLSALRLAWQSRAPGPKAALWQIFYFLEAGVLADHLQRLGVGQLHVHFANAGTSVAMLASEISGIPYSITIHGPDELLSPVQNNLGRKIAHARFVACITHFCRSQAMWFSDQEHWPKLKIVHCGVEPARYGANRKAQPGKNLLFIGRLGPVKGATLLLDAFAALRDRHPEARLTLVGDGPIRGELEAQARALGIDEVTTFTGYLSQDDVAAKLAEADMLALPSFAEGLPVVLMEALASGIPVIASQIAGIPELVRDGETGFVVPAGDVETLTARLDQLLSDPELCARMGAAGRELVRREHDITREAEWLATIFAGQAEGLRPTRDAGDAGVQPLANGSR